MKNNEELTKIKKNQAATTSDKTPASSKEVNKSQDKSKKKDATTIEAEGTESMNQDSKTRKPLFRK